MPSSLQVTFTYPQKYFLSCMCSGVGMVLCGDVWLQLERKGDISIVTKPFIAIFVVNILLWIDFNITIVRRKREKQPRSRQLRFPFSLPFLFSEASPQSRNISFRRLEASLETTVELLGEDAATFVLMTPILWSLQWIR